MSGQHGNPPPGTPPPPPPRGGYPSQPSNYPPPGYGPPQGPQPYGYQPAGYGPPQTQRPNNGYAVASLICSIVGVLFILPVVGPILGIVLGNSAKKQIAQSQGREGGENLAQAGVILGWVGVGLNILVGLFIAVVFIGIFSFIGASSEIIEQLPTLTPSP